MNNRAAVRGVVPNAAIKWSDQFKAWVVWEETGRKWFDVWGQGTTRAQAWHRAALRAGQTTVLSVEDCETIYAACTGAYREKVT